MAPRCRCGPSPSSPILYASTGEKLDQFERFHPDRMAQRILGMGDVMSLIEKAEREFEEDEALELERKLRRNEFGLDDFLDQMKMMRKMGPLSSLLGMIPGFGGHQLQNMKIDERELDRIQAIILSMTPQERRKPGHDQRLPHACASPAARAPACSRSTGWSSSSTRCAR